jgi:hypothetical protein
VQQQPKALNTTEIVALKMAAEGKKTDGTLFKESDPGYISPQEAKDRLAKTLGRTALKSDTVSGKPVETATSINKYTPPPSLVTGNSVPITVMVTDVYDKPADFLLKIEASGMNMLPGNSPFGQYCHGSYTGKVPAGSVKVEIRGGLFRRAIVREEIVKPGASLRVKAKLDKGIAGSGRNEGYAPWRLLYKRSPENNEKDLEQVESVWETKVLAVDGNPQGGLVAAVMPPWPGYGRSVVIGNTKMTAALDIWRQSQGSIPGGSFLADPAVLWNATVLPPENAQLISPKSAFLLWSGLRERFPNAGVFEDCLPAELPALYLTGLTNVVCVQPSRSGLDLFAALSKVYAGVLPAPSPPRAEEAFPNILIWGNPKAPADALETLKNGRYTIGHGLYIYATLDGKPPGVTEAFATGKPHVFKLTIFTAMLSDAGIDEVIIYRNGEVVHREKGHSNETRMQISFTVNEEGPARYWVATLGQAAEPVNGVVAEETTQPAGRYKLFGMTTLFNIGTAPSAEAMELDMVVHATDLHGQPVKGARIIGTGQDIHTDGDGKATVRWRKDRKITVEFQGKSVEAEPLAGNQLLRLYEAANSGALDWKSSEYFNRVRAALANQTTEVMLPVDTAQGEDTGAKTP